MIADIDIKCSFNRACESLGESRTLGEIASDILARHRGWKLVAIWQSLEDSEEREFLLAKKRRPGGERAILVISATEPPNPLTSLAAFLRWFNTRVNQPGEFHWEDQETLFDLVAECAAALDMQDACKHVIKAIDDELAAFPSESKNLPKLRALLARSVKGDAKNG